jgi:molybdopterin molybdotransferase
MSPTPSEIVLSYTEAAECVRRHAEKLRHAERAVEQAPLLAAAGRVLAQPIVADRDQPPFPRATRDGFACRAAELAAGQLRIAGQLRAGDRWTKGPLEKGDAVEIMTGAAVPPGADCVVMIEDVQASGIFVRLTAPRTLAAGENIVDAGLEARVGSILAPEGRRMTVPQIAAAAACGYATLAVFARPRVAILATGDELVDVVQEPLPHQICNSNSYSLAAQTLAMGGAPRLFPVVPDETAATEDALAEASGMDLILLTGGVSVGKFDVVEQALLRRGAEFFFTGARIQPGKPVVFGQLPEGYFFGLPGNPLSTMVTFALFVAPLLRALGGEAETGPRFVTARLEEDVRVKTGLTRFLPARMESDLGGGARARPVPSHGSGDLAAAARANGFVVAPETADRLPAGEMVSMLLL